jgi:folate-binding protein YgfZ
MAELASAAPGGYLLPRDTLVVRGPDRKSWLDGLLTCAVAEVAPGTARYGLLLTKQGKIVSDVFLADSGVQLFVGVAPGQGPAVHALLDRYLVMEDAELVVPDAAPVWLVWVGAEPPPPALAVGVLGLRDLSASLLVVETAPAHALPAAPLAALLAQHGFGAFGTDFGERDNPHEASLDRVAVSWTKGCYLGQEVVCMQDMRGKVKRRLVALAGDAGLLAAAPPGGAFPNVVAGSGEAVGQVTSIHPSPGGACLLASVASSALDSPGQLSVLGRPVRVVTSPGP